MDTTENILRIPISYTVSYAVRGLPGIPTRYHQNIVLMPTQISIIYRTSPDEQLGRIQVFVSGHWMNGTERAADDSATEHFFGDMSKWPDWVADEARRHDPDNAGRTS